MSNLKVKIRAETREQSNEIQKLANSIGIFRPYSGWQLHKGWVCLDGKEMLLVCDSCPGGEEEFKTITLPELRDLVVLKRNDKNDRNVIDPEYDDVNLYLDSKNDLFIFHLLTQTWKESNLNNEPEVLARLQPIKKTMKEYLIKTKEGKYHYINDSYDICPAYVEKIEIPEGENVAYKDNDNGDVYFTRLEMGYRDVDVIWRRHTHPEELPFIDDESKSLNDQYAEIEQVKQQSINETLAERQSSYGCYEDVAQVTQQILKALRIGEYDKMPAPHKESMHMIASKMARLVCGDHNHKDSWHDIGGYAKLIENLID